MNHNLIAFFLLVLLALPVMAFRGSAPVAPPQNGETAPVETAGCPDWGFRVTPPAGWKHQASGNIMLLGHDSTSGLILVLGHREGTMGSVRAQLERGLDEDGLRLIAAGAVQEDGPGRAQAWYSGSYQDQPVKGMVIGTAGDGGAGAYIIAICTPGKFSPELAGAARELARSIRYGKVAGSGSAPVSGGVGGEDLAGYFCGIWVTMTASSERRVTLYPDGTYMDDSESSYSGRFRDGTGADSGGWGTAARNRQRGKWLVNGSREQGVMIFTDAAGESSRIEYRVHVEDGRVYWNEYLFGGKLYARRGTE